MQNVFKNFLSERKLILYAKPLIKFLNDIVLSYMSAFSSPKLKLICARCWRSLLNFSDAVLPMILVLLIWERVSWVRGKVSVYFSLLRSLPESRNTLGPHAAASNRLHNPFSEINQSMCGFHLLVDFRPLYVNQLSASFFCPFDAVLLVTKWWTSKKRFGLWRQNLVCRF